MVKCYKPNMTNLKGKLGREIMAAIKNTPPSNHSKLNRLAEEGIKSVLAGCLRHHQRHRRKYLQ